MDEPNSRDSAEKPLLSPWINLDPDPVMLYTDARGRLHKIRLDPVKLARLTLSCAEAQAGLARRDLNAAVQADRSGE